MYQYDQYDIMNTNHYYKLFTAISCRRQSTIGIIRVETLLLI